MEDKREIEELINELKQTDDEDGEKIEEIYQQIKDLGGKRHDQSIKDIG